MDSSSSIPVGAAAPPLSLSPRSQELRSVLPSVNVTRLPASVTNLVECVGHEIEMIKGELNRCYDNNNNNDDNNDNEEEERLESLEDAIDDGFMCVDLRVLERKLEVWHHLFSPSLSNNNNPVVDEEEITTPSNSKDGDDKLNYTVTPFFAVKCNPDPVVVEWLARSASRASLPLGFDCASIAELELAKKHVQRYSLESWGEDDSNGAVPTTRIVYANPQRAEADLIKALELFATPVSNDACASACFTNDLWLTLDGVEEVYKIAIAKKRFLEKHSRDSFSKGSSHHQQQPLAMPQIKIILRIWVPDGHSQVPLGEKFGMRLDQIDAVVEACLEHGIAAREIIGISFHCGSGCESVETYLEALEMGKTALQAMDQKLLLEAPPLETPNKNRYRCWLLDIGGGFPGLDGLYGDEGRFAAATDSLASTTRTTTAAAAASNHAMEEKKEGDVPTQPQTTVADIAMAVRPVLQSFATNGSDAHTNDDDDNDGSFRQESKPSDDRDQNPPLTLIAEPGRYFVEGAFALASRIYQKQIQETPTEHSKENNKEDDNGSDGLRVYRIPHGVQGVFKDVLLCGESFVPQPLQSESLEENENEKEEDSPLQVPNQKSLYLSKVLGPSGDDSEDVVCESCWLPELQVGDWLVFDRMGAYTLSIASRAGRPVMRYVIGGGTNHNKNEKEE